MRIFVTGGNGFIGSVVVRKLIESGHQVRCLLRRTSVTDRLSGLEFETSYGDVRDRDSVLKGAKGCDAVIHLASLSSWNDIHSPLMHDVVVQGSTNVIEAAIQAGKIPLVFVSSIAAINGTEQPVVHNERSPCTLPLKAFVYSRTKRIVEDLCLNAWQQHKLPAVIVNPSEVYGPNDTALITACNLVDFAKSKPVLACKGGTSIVHVDDVAHGILAALTKGTPGERYILGGDNLSVVELAQLTLDILNQQKKIVQIPNGPLRAIGSLAGKLRIPFPIHPAIIPYATRYWYMDNSKAKTQLGASFRSARQTLEPTLAWLAQSGHISPLPSKTLAA